jgi:hypothetical protein
MTVRPGSFVMSVLAAAALSACAGKAPESSTAAPAASVEPAPSGPRNGAVSAAGSANAPALTAEQRQALSAAVAAAPNSVKPRLRYALAAGDDGKRHLVVYDGQGLGVDGKRPEHPHDYTLFRVLNGTAGDHYDPEQNALIAAIPPPPERETAQVIKAGPGSTPVKIP